MFILILFISSILEFSSSENINVDITKNTVLNEISDKFLSFSVSPNLFQNEDSIFDRECLCMEKFLYPSYMKIRVPSTLGDEQINPNSTNAETMNTEQLIKLMSWMKRARFTPVINLDRGDDDLWNPKSTVKTMTLAEEYGLNDCVWQFGEGCKNESPQQYLTVLKTFKLMMSVFNTEKHGEWKLVSENLNRCLNAENLDIFFNPKIFDALSFDLNNDIQDLNNISHGELFAKKYLEQEDVQLWKNIGEIEGNDEKEKAANWLKTLGETARSYSVLFKNMEENELNIPNLSYYVSLLHKILVGKGVLEIKQSTKSENISFYGHCANLPSGPLSDAVTLFASNSGQDPANINVKLANGDDGGEVVQFIVQEIDSGEIVINGKKNMDNEYLVPLIINMQPFNSLLVSLPPKSIGFWVVTNTNVDACSFNDHIQSKEEFTLNSSKMKRHTEQIETDIRDPMLDKVSDEENSGISIRNLAKTNSYDDIAMEYADYINTDYQEEKNIDARFSGNPLESYANQNRIRIEDWQKIEPIDDKQLIDNDENKETTHNADDFSQSSIVSKNLDFEPVNKVNETMDLDKNFSDLPGSLKINDLEADEVQSSKNFIRSNEMENMEELIHLISQLSSLMELQEEFLGVESSLLQPLSSVDKISGMFKDGMETLKRITRVATDKNNTTPYYIDGVIVLKRINVKPNEELTVERIKDIFFSDVSAKTFEIFQDKNNNRTMLGIDLDERMASDPRSNAVSADEGNVIIDPQYKVEETTTMISDSNETLPILPQTNINNTLPMLNDLINRAKNLLKKVKPNEEEDSIAAESQGNEERVGSPLGLLPLLPPNPRLSTSLANTRMKMHELRLKVQARLANIKAKNLLNQNLHRHSLIKRSLPDKERPIVISQDNKAKNQRKHLFRPVRKHRKKDIDVYNHQKYCKKMHNSKLIDLEKAQKDLTVPHNRLKRSIFPENDDQKNMIGDDFENEPYVFKDSSKGEIFDENFNFKNRKNMDLTNLIGKERKNNPQDNEIERNSFDQTTDKVTKQFMDNEIKKKVVKDNVDANCFAGKINGELNKLRNPQKEMLIEIKRKDTDKNVLDSVFNKVSTFFEGIYNKVMEMYNKNISKS